jgi:hypothetical protein
VIDPLWPLVAAVIAVVLLVVALLAAVCAPFSKRRRVLRIALLGIVYLSIDVAVLLGGLWLWLRHPR